MSSIGTIVNRFGPACEVVEVVETTARAPEANEIVVRMDCSVINPSDLITISGAYSSRISLPFLPGYEGVGTIVAIGGGVIDLKMGTRVLPIGTSGSWQTYKLSEAKWCFPVADALTNEQAATMYVNPATAWLMLHERAKVDPQTNVVISAGASEIGRMMIRMLNRIGVSPIVTVRSPESAKVLQRLSVRAILVTSMPTFKDELADIAARTPVDLVLDAVGGETGAALASSLKAGGLFIHYGLLSGASLLWDKSKVRPGVKFELFALRNWIHNRSREDIERLLNRVETLVLDGTAESEIDSSYPLADITSALFRHEARDRRGKILLSF